MMKHKLLIVPMILALAGAGCGGSGSVTGSVTPSGAPSGSSDSGMAGSGAAVAGGCSNPYYPFKVGSKITYKSSTGATNSTYSLEVQPAASANAHKLVYSFTVKGQTVPITQEFTCDSSGIHADGQLDLASVMGGQFSYQTDSVDGPFLPTNMAVGTNWETTYNVTIHSTNSILAARVDGKHQSTHIKSSVVGEEDVTVPAGTYHALKVKMDITIDSELIGTPVQTTTETWFVKNIGMVKSVSTSNGVDSTTEATAVTGF